MADSGFGTGNIQYDLEVSSMPGSKQVLKRSTMVGHVKGHRSQLNELPMVKAGKI